MTRRASGHAACTPRSPRLRAPSGSRLPGHDPSDPPHAQRHVQRVARLAWGPSFALRSPKGVERCYAECDSFKLRVLRVDPLAGPTTFRRRDQGDRGKALPQPNLRWTWGASIIFGVRRVGTRHGRERGEPGDGAVSPGGSIRRGPRPASPRPRSSGAARSPPVRPHARCSAWSRYRSAASVRCPANPRARRECAAGRR